MCRESPVEASASTRQRLLLLMSCAVGICTCYLAYGILQEKLSHQLPAEFVLLTQSILNTLVGIIWTRGPKLPSNFPYRLVFLTSLCYTLAMLCSNLSFRYVSYPVAVLAKSTKLIPIMLISQLLESKYYNRSEWGAALLICIGICSFQLRRLTFGATTETYGLVLLCISLTLDGVLGSCQNFLKRSTYVPNAGETMWVLNGYAGLLLGVLVWYTGAWRHSIEYYSHDPSVVRQLVFVNVAVGLGQVGIFVTVTHFSSIVTTIITTTRKFLTILVSVLFFGHQFDAFQWTSIAMVFSGLYLAIYNAIQKDTKRKVA